MKEEAASVVESVGDCDGAVEEELAKDKGMGVEARLGCKGVNLLHGFEGLALAQKRHAELLRRVHCQLSYSITQRRRLFRGKNFPTSMAIDKLQVSVEKLGFSSNHKGI
ncbi:hypothetical protein FF1_015598 [Malus domestica]